MNTQANPHTAGILAGIRVLDFSRYLAGPFCASILSDLGAEVIRVEPIGGGQDRHLAPVTAKGDGAVFLQLNRNKSSLAIESKTPDGRAAIEALVRTADIVVTNMPPAALSKAGMDYETLRLIKSDIITTNISGYGKEGPLRNRPSFDAVGQAMSGAAFLGGTPGHPSRSGSSYVDYGTGMAGAVGALAALHHRNATGKGQDVDASLFATAHTFLNAPHIEAAVFGSDHEPAGNRSPNSAPSDFIATCDGMVVVQIVGNSAFKRWAKMIERPELGDDPELQTDRARAQQNTMLSVAMTDWAHSRSTEKVLDALVAAGLPGGPVRSPKETIEDPQTWQSGIFERVDHPDLDVPLPIARMPFVMGSMPREIDMQFAQAGEHTNQILASAGYDQETIAALIAAGVCSVANDTIDQ